MKSRAPRDWAIQIVLPESSREEQEAPQVQEDAPDVESPGPIPPRRFQERAENHRFKDLQSGREIFAQN